MQGVLPEDKEALAAWIVEAARRIVVHYGLWFNETAHQTGLDPALKLEAEAGDRWLSLLMGRISKALGFELRQGLPGPLLDLPRETLEKLAEALHVSWLAMDGVWFQALEQARSMYDAQRANDTCWTRFSPYEAFRIKTLAELPEQGGLGALKTALGLRLYARINTQEFEEPEAGVLVFRMVECRVQRARRRKGLDFYPCKQGGLMEYRHFAWAVDPRIRTECLSCPPDPAVDGQACAWRFVLREED